MKSTIKAILCLLSVVAFSACSEADDPQPEIESQATEAEAEFSDTYGGDVEG